MADQEELPPAGEGESFPADHFSAVWTGYLLPLRTEEFSLYVSTDAQSSVELAVDGTLEAAGSETVVEGRVWLTAGELVEVAIHYKHKVGNCFQPNRPRNQPLCPRHM
ncbi:unnamed protein product [Chrysoparadoxa australica]